MNHRRTNAFTLVEVMVSMTVVTLVMGMCLSTFLMGMRTLYKDNQRLATNANLRSFMAQISKETLDASFFYVFPYYTSITNSINLATAPASMAQIENAADDDYDKWVAHGDCLVLVTRTSQYRTTDIRQIRIYYRTTTTQASRNSEAPLRYYETADWGEGTSTASNGHTDVATELNAINLNANPLRSGSRLINARTVGRKVPSPYTGYTAGDRYPIFCTESPDSTPTNGFVSINLEFINGSDTTSLLSSSSFNYTISPRR
jgi:type II secretory pathway pseudopilin PulG